MITLMQYGIGRFVLYVQAVVIISMGLIACRGSDDNAPRTLLSIEVTKAPQSLLAKAAKATKLGALAASLPAGFTQQYVATGTYNDGACADLTATARWSSSNEIVATVVAGVVDGQQAGHLQVNACQGQVCGIPQKLEVSNSIVTGLVVTPLAAVRAGLSTRLKVEAHFSDQRPLLDVTGDPALNWRSSDELIASVAEDGQVTGIQEGLATMTVEGEANGQAFHARGSVAVTGPLDVEPFVAPNPIPLTWMEADTYCKGLNPSAHLPTRVELQHLFINRTSAKVMEGDESNEEMCTEYGWSLGKGHCGGSDSDDSYWTRDVSEAGNHYYVHMSNGRANVFLDTVSSQVACIR